MTNEPKPFKGRRIIACVELHDYAANKDCDKFAFTTCLPEELEDLILFVARANVQRHKSGLNPLCLYINPELGVIEK